MSSKHIKTVKINSKCLLARYTHYTTIGNAFHSYDKKSGIKKITNILVKISHLWPEKDKAKNKTLNLDYPWKPPAKPPIPSTQNISCTVNNKPKTFLKKNGKLSKRLIRGITWKWTKFFSSFLEVEKKSGQVYEDCSSHFKGC